MARTAVMALVLGTALVLQTVVTPAIQVGWARPDPVLLTVVAFALPGGRATGARYGFAAGLAVDLLSGGGLPVGLWSLTLSLVGYGVGAVGGRLNSARLGGQMAAAALAAFAAATAVGTLAVLLEVAVVSPVDLLRTAAGTALYNLALLPLVLSPLAVLSQRFGEAAPAAP